MESLNSPQPAQKFTPENVCNVPGREHIAKNDLDWYICGGSSGGSAAAVAAGTCLA